MTDAFFSGNDADQGEEEFDDLRSELAAALAAFSEDHDVDENLLSFLLLDAAMTQRTLAYALSVAKPSENGLKFELDRFGRAFGELLRDAKKQAGSTVPMLRDLIDYLEADDPDEEN